MQDTESKSPAARQGVASPRDPQPPRDVGWLAAPLVFLLAGLCCGGPLLVAALVATGAGAWLGAHGFQAGAVVLLIIAGLLAWRWRLHINRGS